MRNLFILSEDHTELVTGDVIFPKGTLLLQGDNDEWFNMSQEIADGWGVGYSDYNVPQDKMFPAPQPYYKMVEDHFTRAGFNKHP